MSKEVISLEELAKETAKKINHMNNEWNNDLQQGIITSQADCNEWSTEVVLSALQKAVIGKLVTQILSPNK